MVCKNCGMKISDDSKVCPNCGAYVDDSLKYTLLSDDDRYYDVFSNEKKKKKKLSPFQNFLIFLLVIAVAGGGAFLYFDKIRPAVDKAPQVEFSSGSGIINRDEQVVYIAFKDSKSEPEYIQGVSLYNYDREKNKKGAKAVSSDYEYTKSVDSTFRAIYFDLDGYNLRDGENYTYTFEVKLSFEGSDKIYTYYKTAGFAAGDKTDISDIVFDHSLDNTIE